MLKSTALHVGVKTLYNFGIGFKIMCDFENKWIFRTATSSLFQVRCAWD